MFLKREQDIADGTTLDFSSFSVEVVDVRREPPTAPEQGAMKDVVLFKKQRNRQSHNLSSQGRF